MFAFCVVDAICGCTSLSPRDYAPILIGLDGGICMIDFDFRKHSLKSGTVVQFNPAAPIVNTNDRIREKPGFSLLHGHGLLMLNGI